MSEYPWGKPGDDWKAKVIPNNKTYRDNYDKIFRKEKKDEEIQSDSGPSNDDKPKND